MKPFSLEVLEEKIKSSSKKLGAKMLIKDYILQLFLFMLGINFILFIFLLIRKMYMKILTNKKEYLEKKYEEQILSYISNHDKSIIIIPRTKLEIRVFRNLLLNYSSLLTGETKELLNDC